LEFLARSQVLSAERWHEAGLRSSAAASSTEAEMGLLLPAVVKVVAVALEGNPIRPGRAAHPAGEPVAPKLRGRRTSAGAPRPAQSSDAIAKTNGGGNSVGFRCSESTMVPFCKAAFQPPERGVRDGLREPY